MTGHESNFDNAIAQAVQWSRFVARYAARPDVYRQLQFDLQLPWDRETLRQVFTEEYSRLGPEADPARPLGIALRRMRLRLILALAVLDLNQQIDLDRVVTAMSEFADLAVSEAATVHGEALAAVHGSPLGSTTPPPGHGLIVFGMGKLGGRELNVSSDIDLIFAYPEEGETSGPRPLSFHEFYQRLGQRMIDTLARVNEYGFVFRVDMRLRPFGDAGPLVSSLATLADYFQSHGRAWERYAWAKARALCGRASDIEQARQSITAFVYRRYADFGLTESLRDLSRRIRLQHGAADRDIKLAPGGIRECEFLLQSLQLVYGGRDTSLQTHATRDLARRLVAAGRLPAAQAERLLEHYRFLRDLEHRIQYLDDQHTQTLPSDPADLAAIAASLRLGSVAALLTKLASIRAEVAAEFAAGIADPTYVASDAAALANLLVSGADTLPAAPFEVALAEPGMDVAGTELRAAIAAALAAFAASTRWRRLPERTQARLARFLAELVRQALWQTQSLAVVERGLLLADAVARREAYVALLAENPGLVRPLAYLMSRSAWAARRLTTHPLLLEELARGPRDTYRTDWAAERIALSQAVIAADDDEERCLNLLRDYKLVHEFRLAVAALEADLAVMLLADELSALADSVIQTTLEHVARRMRLPDVVNDFAVIGYGKLGGKELGFGSDLDIVFLYDDSTSVSMDVLTRYAQRINTALSVNTTSGRLYEVDLRLRPDGAAGLLVSTVSAFATYQRERAWFWEHQALTRARAVAGSAMVGAAFEAIRREIIGRNREMTQVARDVLAMRAKMRVEHKGREYDADVKHVPGGLIDLEFAVQAIILAWASEHPELEGNWGNRALLAMAGRVGILSSRLALDAGFAYLTLRDHQTRCTLDEIPAKLGAPDQFARERQAILAVWEWLEMCAGEGKGD
jgi:[glutamine synthetase] adenylyltransferase / [glutamine synthetase]-adenylyl-L-tyrosine phosphorylase